jgi:hypothetical protein
MVKHSVPQSSLPQEDTQKRPVCHKFLDFHHIPCTIRRIEQHHPSSMKDAASNCLFSSFKVASPPPRAHSAADASGSRLPGRADGYPSGRPTDPYVRNSRIRFLKQSLCYPPQSTGVLVSGLVRAKSLPWFPPVGHSARRRLPSRRSLEPHFPTCHGTMRRDDCHRAPLGSLRLSLAS